MPGQSVGDLLVNLGINVGGFTAGLGQAEGAMVSAGTRMYFLGSRIAAGFGVPLALAASAIAGFGMTFDKAMTESLAIMQDVTPAIRKEMETVAKAVSESSTFTAEQTAKAYYGLASAGYTAVEAMKLLPVVTRFAQAGVMDLAKATEYLSTAQMAMGMYVKGDYNKNMEEMTRISDVLTEANNRSVGTVEQFAQALTNKAGQSLRFFGKSVEEGVAALAMFHQQGILGKAAGQQLFVVLRDIGTQSIRLAPAWQKMGIAVYDSSGKMRNLADIMGDLEKRTDGMSDKGKRMLLMMLGIPARSQSAVIALMGVSESLRDFQSTLESAGGATETVAKKQLQSFLSQLAMMRNQGIVILIDLFGSFSNTINTVIIPALQDLLVAGKALSTWLASLPQFWKTALVAMTGFLIAMGPVILIIGSSLLAFRGLVGIVSVVGTAIGGLVIRLGILSALWPAFGTGALSGAAALAVYGQNTALAATGVKVLGVTLSGFVSTSLIAITAIGLIGYAMYSLVKQSDGLRAGIDRDAKAFNNQTQALADAVRKYDEYWARQFKIGLGPQQAKDVKEYESAIRGMANALGISEQQMIDELSASNDMLDSLREQIKLRRALAQEARLSSVAEAGAIDEKMSQLREQYRALQSGVVKVPARTEYDPSGFPIEIPGMTVKLDPKVRTRQQADLMAQIEQLKNQRDAILQNPAWSRGSDVVLGGSKKPGGLPPDTEDPELAKKKAGVDAYLRSVEEMAGFFAGEGKRSFDVLRDAWAKLNGVQQTSPDVLERVWEAYKKIRPDLSPDEFPADIEFMTSSLREQEETMATWGKGAEQMTEGMDGLNPATEKLRSNFGFIVAKFNELGGIDPKWFATNREGLEGLLIEYGTLPPGIQRILDKYIEWKKQNRELEISTANATSKIAEQFGSLESEMAARVVDKQTELLGYALNTADKELIGLKHGLAELRTQHTLAFVKMADDLKHYTGSNKEMAAKSMANTRQMMTEVERLTESLELLRIASALGADKFTLSWLSKQNLDRMKDVVRLLGTLYDRLLQIGRVSGSIQSIGDAFSAWGMTGAGEWLTKTADLMERAGKAGATLAVGLETHKLDKIIQGLSGIAAAFGEISQMATKSERAISGAMTGASAGFAVGGGWGALVGGIFGGVSGAMMPDPGWAKIQESVRKNYGMAISQGIAQAIADVAAKHLWMSDRMATIFSLDVLIDQEGGVNDATIDTWTKRLGEMFTIWADYRGKMDALMAKQRAGNALIPGTDPNFGLAEQIEALGKAAADLQNTFDRVFPKIAEAVVKSGKIASKEFLNLIQLMRQTGLESQALAEFATAQLSRFTAAWDKVIAPLMVFVTGLQSAKDELLAFNEEMAKSGKYDAKTGKYSDLGIEDQERLAEILKKIEDLYKKDTHAAAEAGIEAERMGRLLVAAFNGAIRSGMDLFAAIDAIGPQLDQLILAYKVLGIESDSAALKQLMHMRELINANPELVAGVQALNELTLALSNLGGLTAESLADLEAQGLSMYERMITAGFTETETLAAMAPWLRTVYEAHIKLGIPIDANTQALIDQAKKLGLLDENDPTKILKKGFEDLIQAVKDLTSALLGIPTTIDTKVNVHTSYSSSGTPPGNPGDPDPNPLPQAHGGNYWVTRPTLFLAGEAGPEQAIFSGANRRFQGGETGGGTVIIKIGPRTLAELIVPHIPGVVREYGLG